MRANILAGLWLLTTACRFGGPSGTATEVTDPVEAGEDGSAEEDREDARDEDDVSPPPSVGFPPDSVDDEPAFGACGPATVPGCDPVRGTNCAPGISQCIADPGAAEPAGRCVFPGMATAAGCDENGLFTTCPPLFTCKAGACRKYCYCDSDCPPGDTCSESSGQDNTGLFKLCLAARP